MSLTREQQRKLDQGAEVVLVATLPPKARRAMILGGLVVLFALAWIAKVSHDNGVLTKSAEVTAMQAKDLARSSRALILQTQAEAAAGADARCKFKYAILTFDAESRRARANRAGTSYDPHFVKVIDALTPIVKSVNSNQDCVPTTSASKGSAAIFTRTVAQATSGRAPKTSVPQASPASSRSSTPSRPAPATPTPRQPTSRNPSPAVPTPPTPAAPATPTPPVSPAPSPPARTPTGPLGLPCLPLLPCS